MSSPRTYDYEIGAQRPDGKHNIWAERFVHFGPTIRTKTWVIVQVAQTYAQAVEWIRAERLNPTHP